MTGSHRAAWLAFRGEIDDDMVIDHLCRVRSCCNPTHLELVTISENGLRGELKGHVGRKSGPHNFTGCGRHAYSDGYMHQMKTGGWRWVCRPCASERRARYLDRK